MLHEAHRAGGNDFAQLHEVLKLEIVLAGEVTVKVADQLTLLLVNVVKIDEETGTHVLLQTGHRRRMARRQVFEREQVPARVVAVARDVIAHEEVAIAEKASAAYFLGAMRADSAVLQVPQRGGKIAVHAFGHHGRMKPIAHVDFGLVSAQSVAKLQICVQDDLERVDAEFVLSPHRLHEFQFQIAS